MFWISICIFIFPVHSSHYTIFLLADIQHTQPILHPREMRTSSAVYMPALEQINAKETDAKLIVSYKKKKQLRNSC